MSQKPARKKTNNKKNKKQNFKIFLKFFFVIPVFFLFFFVLSSNTHAANGVNKQINFQGKLVDNNGLNVADSTYTVILSLYNVSSAGTAAWTETDTVTTVAGVFQVPLGGVTSLAGFDFNQDTWYLGIKVGADAEMTPRIRYTAVPYAFNADKLDGVVATNSATTFTLSGSTATLKTLTVSDSTTLATNAITFGGGEVLTLSATNALTFNTTASTNITLPTAGTLLTNTATANQTLTSTQTSGTVLGISDSTAETAATIGQSITLSGTGAFDQTGLQFNLSNASGTNLNDIVGTGSTWKVSRSGALTVASCTGCGGVSSGGLVQVPTSNTAGATSANVISPTAASIIGLTINGTTNATAADVLDIASGVPTAQTSTNGILFNQNSAGTTLNGLNITQTSGVLTNGISFTGAISNDITTGSSNRNLTITPNGTGTVAITSSATSGTSMSLTANSLNTGNGLLVTSSGVLTGAGSLASFTGNNATTGTILSVSGTGLTTGKGINVIGGSSATTGSDLYLNGAIYKHTTAETGSLAVINFNDQSSDTTGADTTITNGLNVLSQFTTTGAAAKNINGVNIAAPTTQSCISGLCTWEGLKITTPASAANVTAGAIAVVAGGVPGADMVNITNAGQGVTTAGINALSINYIGGAAAVESAAERIDLTPGGTSGGTWNGIRIVSNTTGPVAGVTETSLKLEAPTTGGAGTFNGLNIINLIPATNGTVNGIQLASNAITQSAANTATLHGLYLTAPGALTTNTAAGTINWDMENYTTPTSTVGFAGSTITTNGLKIATGNITQTAGTVAANGVNITLGTMTTGGTQTGVNITPSNSNATGTEVGVNIANITAGAATQNALVIGSGWNSDLVVNGTPILNGSGVLQSAGLSGTYINAITFSPTGASVIPLTVNATSGTAANAVNVNQSQGGADAVDITMTNAAGTNTNGLLVKQNGAGTTTNGIQIQQSAGTLTNGLTFTGTFTNLTSGTNWSVTNAGIETLGKASTTQGGLVFANTSAFTTTFKASNATTASVTYLWPTADAASSGYVLSSNAAGTLSWVASGGGGGCAACVQLVPTTTAANTVAPTVASVIGLTVNATSGTAANAVNVNQSQGGADAVDITMTNAAGTNTNGLLVKQNGAGTTTNGIQIQQSAGTLTNGLLFSGTFTKDITTAGGTTGTGLTISSGAGTAGAGGSINITAGSGSSGNVGGSVSILGGAGPGVTGTGGNMTVDAGTSAGTGGTLNLGTGGANSINIGNSTAQTTISALGTTCTSSGAAEGLIFKFNTIQEGHFCYASGTGMKIFANSTITSGTDVAENYSDITNNLVPGDIVSLDLLGPRKSVIKTSTAYEGNVFGVVSTNPGVQLSDISENNGQTELIHPKPIALTGRIPTKVSIESGAIHIGDYITSSSVSGVGMKATHAGYVIGQALENYSGNGQGIILVFARTAYFNGLPSLVATKGILGNTDLISYIGQDLHTSLQLNPDGKIVINGDNPENAIVFDKQGNATFGGTISAKTIQAEHIIGLDLITDRLVTLSASVASLSGELQSSSSATPDILHLATLTVDTIATISGNLRVQNDALFEGMLHVVDTITTSNLLVSKVADFFGTVFFHGDVNFAGRAIFNNDTAGVALIKKDADRVTIMFTKDYPTAPIITATISLGKSIDLASERILEHEILEANYGYIVANKTSKGFTILLNKKATSDVPFSWSAVAVNNAQIFQSDGTAFAQEIHSSASSSSVLLPTPFVTVTPSP